ncbi:MAG: septal ring lytic transglycosylase RlpA family protein [Candidatus Obscuribacterales bacterium]|nr:septal ring lytic transglycosylase RlpA family protein [Candidatus Obscuribacterales bacterium]
MLKHWGAQALFKIRLCSAISGILLVALVALPVIADCPVEPTVSENGIPDTQPISAHLPFMGKIPEGPVLLEPGHGKKPADITAASPGTKLVNKSTVENAVKDKDTGVSLSAVELPVVHSKEEKFNRNAKAPSSNREFSGLADYYHHKLYGQKTASGQILHKAKMTAAHRTLPFGTKVRVTNKHSGRSCVVVINDRGPFTPGKVIDLSHAAAVELDVIRAGTCKVACTVLED